MTLSPSLLHFSKVTAYFQPMFPFYPPRSLVFWYFKWVWNCNIASNWVNIILEILMCDKVFIRKVCKNKMGCLTEINFRVNLFSRMTILNFFAWINFRR